MFSPRSSQGLGPFQRRALVALLAAIPAVLVARAVGAYVPDDAATASLGAFLFEVGVQAVVAALVWPAADRLVPPGRDETAGRDG